MITHDIVKTDPCPCGSGNVFGECCFLKLEALTIVEMPTAEGPAMEQVSADIEWKFGLGAVCLPFDSVCAESKCQLVIAAGDVAFVDRDSRMIWCHNCGKCERYHRKKEAQRNR